MSRSLNFQSSTFAPGPLVVAGLILLAALSRLLPHPPNFTPIAAMALFGGAYFASRKWSIIVPILALAISDILLAIALRGTYADYLTSPAYFISLATNYACVIATVMMGFGLRGKTTGGRVLGYSLAAAVLFFLVSNFSVWLTSHQVPGYNACNISIGACYVAAIPFFKWTALSSVFYAALLFGGFSLLRKQVPALRAHTV